MFLFYVCGISKVISYIVFTIHTHINAWYSICEFVLYNYYILYVSD